MGRPKGRKDLKPRGRIHSAQAVVDRYTQALAEGKNLTQAQLAAEFGVSQGRVSQILRERGVRTRSHREASPPTFDTDAAVEMYFANEKMTMAEVGAIFGVSFGRIQEAVRRSGREAKPDRVYAKYTECDRDFFRTPTPVSAYFAGFVAADGCVPQNRRSVAFGVHPKDRCILESLKLFATLDQPIRDKPNNTGRVYSWLDVCSVDWVEALERYYSITPAKSLTLKPPKIRDDTLLWHFLRGCFDGDGHANKRGNSLAFTSGSPFFLDWLLDFIGEKPGHIQEVEWETDDRERYISARTVWFNGDARDLVARRLYTGTAPGLRLERKFLRLKRRKGSVLANVV